MNYELRITIYNLRFMIEKGNIYSEPENYGDELEIFEVLRKTDKILIEKITSKGALKKPGEWYDQEDDEWVMLLRGEAKLEFQNGKILSMTKGDYIFIPSHHIHRVVETSASPNCLWLAFHGDLS